MNFNQLVTEILKVLPEATFDEDSYGQIVIYTNKCQVDPDNNQALIDLDEAASV